MLRKRLTMLGLIVAMLAAMDLCAAGALHLLAGSGKAGALVNYFEYGRSVPAKLRDWSDGAQVGNLFDAAWRDEMMVKSAAGFAAEDASIPRVRVYGLSFVDQVVGAAKAQAPTLEVDRHSGPTAPANFTFAAFLDDRPNRRAGDVAVFGVLASNLHALASFSNRFWLFEQPAPFTYPIFLPDSAGGLTRIEPRVETAAQQRAILADPSKGEAWRAQVAEFDRMYAPEAFLVPQLDVSPFVRLVRRSLALGALERRKAAILDPDGDVPVAEILRRMIVDFARIAREDGQVPVVVLIQDARGRRDLLEMAGPALEATGVAYVASADHADPREPTNFLPDGHFRPVVNERLGAAFLDSLPAGVADPRRQD